MRKAVICLILGMLTLIVGGSSAIFFASPKKTNVILLRVPNGGIQPQSVIDSAGTIHMIYLSGSADASDIFYVRIKNGSEEFSSPIRVNSESGSAIAAGTVRGPHIALGGNGRIHVAWMGSKSATPKGPAQATPMLYTRLNDSKTAFEPQRNVMQFAVGLDGGASIAADQTGGVYVFWHGRGEVEGESHRRVWLARSFDEGRTFQRETSTIEEPTGACGCCGMRAVADGQGYLYALYRTATADVDRDMFLMTSTDKGKTFTGSRIHTWKLSACPMSTASITEGGGRMLAAWETKGQVYFGNIKRSATDISVAVSASGEGGGRKHPITATNLRGETLLVWTEGTGWTEGGSLAWQMFDKADRPVTEKGQTKDVPVWGLATVQALPTGDFLVIY